MWPRLWRPPASRRRPPSAWPQPPRSWTQSRLRTDKDLKEQQTWNNRSIALITYIKNMISSTVYIFCEVKFFKCQLHHQLKILKSASRNDFRSQWANCCICTYVMTDRVIFCGRFAPEIKSYSWNSKNKFTTTKKIVAYVWFISYQRRPLLGRGQVSPQWEWVCQQQTEPQRQAELKWKLFFLLYHSNSQVKTTWRCETMLQV